MTDRQFTALLAAIISAGTYGQVTGEMLSTVEAVRMAEEIQATVSARIDARRGKR